MQDYAVIHVAILTPIRSLRMVSVDWFSYKEINCLGGTDPCNYPPSIDLSKPTRKRLIAGVHLRYRNYIDSRFILDGDALFRIADRSVQRMTVLVKENRSDVRQAVNKIFKQHLLAGGKKKKDDGRRSFILITQKPRTIKLS